MSVKTDASGNRYVELEFEVPGTPEQVWRAVATGPGISSWFVPTEVEEREGGALMFHLGPGMDSPGIVTGWEPPRRFAYEEPDWSPGAPPVATELLVEARSGGTCVVRMVHSLFTSSEEWDDQLEGFESGWPPFFDVLRLV
ncbi:MAG TPA: SRPBCC domain-containing protein, partial [Thermoanaerobaculia bacterium]